MTRIHQRLALLLMALLALSGCREGNPAPGGDPDLFMPVKAQPRLPTIKLFLTTNVIEAEMALTPREISSGMMFRTNIQETDAMLFVLSCPQQAGFWMKNCPESLSAAYITADGVIREIHRLEKNNTNTVLASRNDIQFVLETRDGWFERHGVIPGARIQTERGSLKETFFRNISP